MAPLSEVSGSATGTQESIRNRSIRILNSDSYAKFHTDQKRVLTRVGQGTKICFCENLYRINPNTNTFCDTPPSKHISLCNVPCLFRPGERIEFRDASDLGRVVKVARTAPDRPLVLSRSPDPDSDQLLYMNWTDFHVKQLNCRTSSLRPAHHNRLKVNTPVADFCVAGVAAGGDDSDDHSQSVVTVSGARIEVFDLTTKLLNFRLCGHLAGVAEPIAPCSVTATRWGHVLVSDRDNQCVHMFNLQADDPYMGVLLQARDLGLGKPCKIRWCEKTSSIVVVLKSTDRNETSIGVIKVR